MMLLPVARVAAAALVGSVAFHTGRNVYETVSIVSKPQQRAPSRLPLPQSVSDLQKLSRQEIITLYLNDCTALPSDLTHIQGAWNGALLNCNGLTRITKFITNQLFGRGRRWNGKVFHGVTTRTAAFSIPTTLTKNVFEKELNEQTNSITSGTGSNQFEVLTQYQTRNNKNDKRRKRHPSKTTVTSSTTVILKTVIGQNFEYKIDVSRLHPHEPSICLDYTQHQGRLSLWRGMKDEIRILPISSSYTIHQNKNSMNTNEYDILIGLGSLSWSGGIYNCSPFCLYRKK